MLQTVEFKYAVGDSVTIKVNKAAAIVIGFHQTKFVQTYYCEYAIAGGEIKTGYFNIHEITRAEARTPRTLGTKPAPVRYCYHGECRVGAIVRLCNERN